MKKFKYHIYFIIGALIVLMFSSCMTESRLAKICATCPVVTEVVTAKKDSSWAGPQKVKHDTVYKSVPGPTVTIPSPCDKFCDGNGKLKSFSQESKHNGIKQRLYSDTTKNQLIQTASSDSLMQVNTTILNENNRLIRENTDLKQTKIIQEDCKRDHKDWLDKYDRPVFWLVFLGLIIFGLIKFGPRILKLVKFI